MVKVIYNWLKKYPFRFYLHFSVFILILFLVIGMSKIGYCQAVGPAFDTGIQSPTAASLGKFGDISTNLYSGTPNLSIPLYEIKEGDLSVPITLKYNYRGMKIENIPGWVGLGWTLDAGGVITRTVQGIADDDNYGFYWTGDDLENNYPTPSSNYITLYNSGEEDPQSDLYFYNIGKEAGKFYLDTNRNIMKANQNNSEISYSSSSGIFHDWTIKSGNGTKYNFNTGEISRTYSTTQAKTEPVKQYVSSWYLNEISSPSSNNHIDFYYSIDGSTTIDRKPYRETINVLGSGCTGDSNNFIEYQDELNPVHLDSIISKSHKIIFQRSPRSDFPNLTKLDEIEIYSSGNLVKRIQLNYSYPTSGKLTLVSVTEVDKNGTPNPPYEFEYIDGSVPGRLSRAVDHWGYYNGKASNAVYNYDLPEVRDYNHELFYDGVDRSADNNYSRIGLLTKITYPTGGYSTFEYEGNDIGAIGTKFSGTVISSEDTEKQEKCTVYYNPSSNEQCTKTFTVNDPRSQVPVTIFSELNKSSSSGGKAGGIVSMSYMRLIRTSDSYVVWERNSNNLQVEGTFEDTINLTSGTEYKLIVFVSSLDDVISNMWASVEWTKELPGNSSSPYGRVEVGGNRIKKITHFDGINHDNDTSIEYKYNYDGDPEISSGVLVSSPINYAYYIQDGCGFVIRSTGSISPLGITGGGNVGYSEVTQIMTDGSNQYRKVNYYSTARDFPNVLASPYPLGPQTSKEYGRGKLLKTENYDSNSDLLSRKSNNYSTDNSDYVPAMHLRKLGAIEFYSQDGGTSYGTIGAYASYEYQSHFYHVSQKKQTNFSPITSNSLETRVQYSFDQVPSYYNLTSKITTNSDEQVRKTDYTYAHEHYLGMDNAHMLTQPYKVTTKDGANNVLKIHWTLWKLFNVPGTSTDYWHPCEQWVGGPDLGTSPPPGC
jgi:hypothetical protein